MTASLSLNQSHPKPSRLVFLLSVGILVAMQSFSWWLLLAYFPYSSSTNLQTNAKRTSSVACDESSSSTTSYHNPATAKQRIHLVVVRDDKFAHRYKPFFDRMEAYANKQNYTWTILGKEYFETRKTPTPCGIHGVTKPIGHFFFLKHCLVAAWMEEENFPPTDAIFVFDSDVLPYRTDVRLEKWADLYQESAVLYCRGWHDDTNEIMAGNYLVRNTVQGRDFLRGWAMYEFVQPSGFSSYDNGAIHLHLLRHLGFESWRPVGECGTLYNKLRLPPPNLSEYWKFVACTRKSLTTSTDKDNQTFSNGKFTFRLLPKWTSWVEDFYIDNAPTTRVPRPVFHHGVKIDTNGKINGEAGEYERRYNLTLVEPTPVGPGLTSVSCGKHFAASCGKCPQGHGSMWCHGQCHWCEHGAAAGPNLSRMTENLQCILASRPCLDNEQQHNKTS